MRPTLLRMAVDPLVSSFEHDGQMDGAGTVPFEVEDEGGFGSGVKLTVMSFLRLREVRVRKRECQQSDGPRVQSSASREGATDLRG